MHYDYDGEPTTVLTFRNHLTFGMLAKETSSLDSDKCYWYSREDLNNSNMMNWAFRASALASALGTLFGAVNFIHSLSLWCRKVKRSSVRYLAFVSAFCILCGIVTQLIFYSGICMFETCQESPDGSDITCVDSQCSFGHGFYLSMVAIFFWLIAVFVLVYLLRESKDQYREMKRLKSLREEEMKRNAEIEEGLNDSPRSYI